MTSLKQDFVSGDLVVKCFENKVHSMNDTFDQEKDQRKSINRKSLTKNVWNSIKYFTFQPN